MLAGILNYVVGSPYASLLHRVLCAILTLSSEPLVSTFKYSGAGPTASYNEDVPIWKIQKQKTESWK